MTFRDEMKKCTKCFVVLPIDEFRVRSQKNKIGETSIRIMAYCKGCETYSRSLNKGVPNELQS